MKHMMNEGGGRIWPILDAMITKTLMKILTLRLIFETKILDQNWDSENKRKLPRPRSLETRYHTLGSSPVNDLLHLVDNCVPKSALMDRLLLKLSIFFAVIYTCFAITISIFPSSGVQDLLSRLYIVDGISNWQTLSCKSSLMNCSEQKTIRCLVLWSTSNFNITEPLSPHWFLQGILHPWNWPTLPFWALPQVKV